MSGQTSTKEARKPKILQQYELIAGAYRARLQRFRDSFLKGAPVARDAAESERPEIGFLITPWIATAVPFLSLEMALLLQKGGHRVRLLFDEAEIAKHRWHDELVGILEEVVDEARGCLPVSKLSDFSGGSPPELNGDRLERVTRNLAIWMQRGERDHGRYLEDHPDLPARISAALARALVAMRETGVSHLVIPGGFFGVSGVHRCAAEILGLSYTTYDSNDVILLSGQNSAAGHQRDLIELYRRRKPEMTPALMEAARETVMAEIARRRGGTDTYAWHREAVDLEKGAANEDAAYDILVLLNIRWDAAGLDLEVSFESVEEWLVSLLDWLEKHDAVRLCIRDHPRGNTGIPCDDDYSDLVASRPKLQGRVRYVRGDEPMNTYRAIDRCKVVLTWSTSAGIEAAILGKPVIVHNSAYYGDMGFCRKAEDPASYFKMLEEVVNHPYELSREEIEGAVFTLFLVLRCSFFSSRFNPYAEPFSEWVETPPDELLARDDVRQILQSMTGQRSLADCAFERWLLQQPGAAAESGSGS